MDKIKLRAIVIKEIPIGESDKLLILLAKGIGKITVKAKGARNTKNKTSCGTSLFSYCDYIVIKSKGGYILTQADIIENFYNITLDLDKLAYSSAALEIAEKVCRENEPEDSIMLLLLKIIQKISKGRVSPRIALIVYYIKFMQFFGCMPDCICSCGGKAKYVKADGFYCENCKNSGELIISEEAANIINYVMASEINKVFSFEINDILVSELEKILQFIFEYNIDVDIKSIDFIKRIKN